MRKNKQERAKNVEEQTGKSKEGGRTNTGRKSARVN